MVRNHYDHKKTLRIPLATYCLYKSQGCFYVNDILKIVLISQFILTVIPSAYAKLLPPSLVDLHLPMEGGVTCSRLLYTLVHWYTGTLVHWYTGTLVHWYTGTLVH